MAKKRGNAGKSVHKKKVSVTKLSNIRSSKSSTTKHGKTVGKSSKSGSGKKPPRGFWNRASHAAGVKAGVIKEKKPKKNARQLKGEDAEISKNPKEKEPEEDVEEEEEDEEEDATEDFTGEDLEYIQTMGFGENFLSSVDDSELPTSQKSSKRKKDDADNKLQPYEMEPRSIPVAATDPQRKMKQLLPIKHAKGFEFRWEERKNEEERKEATEEVEDEDEETHQDVEEEKPALPALSTVELFTLRERKLTLRKQRIANLSHAVLTDPERNINKLKDLRMMLEEKERDVVVTVQKLVMVSLVEVFKDISPGYRIREWGEKAKAVELSRDVKKKRDFEEGLLKQYKAYLSFLEKACRGHKKSKKQIQREKEQGKSTFDLPESAKRSLAEVAARCLCSLMTSLHHFNYRTNIINVVVSLMTSEHEEICNTCCLNVRTLFKTDHVGEAVLDAVRFISRLIRSHNYSVSPKVLNTFLSLKIKEVTLPEEEDKKKKLIEKKEKLKKMSRSQKKHQKRLAEVEKELQATEASENKNKRKKLHTEIIQSVFATYFRILKKASNSVLLSSVLEGLSKFAHLINIDFFDDLVKVLYTLIDSGDLRYRDSLHCVLTAFLILSGQGDVLNIDPTKFYTLLYVTMPQVHAGDSSADARLILDCIDAMITKRHKQVTFQRVLAFLKRLATLALQMMPNGILGYGCAIRNIMKWYPKSDLLLDSESFGSGRFLPELPEAEHCNAQSTALWELHLLKRHYHPTVREYAQHITKGNPLTGIGALPVNISRLSAQKTLKEFSPDQMIFNPPIDTRRGKKKTVVVMKEPDSDYVQKDFDELVNRTLISTPDVNDIHRYLVTKDDKSPLALNSDLKPSVRDLKRKGGRTDEQTPRKKAKHPATKNLGSGGKKCRTIEETRLKRRNGQGVNR
ncbi:nucleolar complex protein 3 homolog [Patiria miniata]|uniref:NOC3-like protein n=1 Tax=Patiria miniata TaxID=46514 RepID=A0A914B4H2_PATMI|nr:nucleolar complex protein 3 homolog [Patiria miniata]